MAQPNSVYDRDADEQPVHHSLPHSESGLPDNQTTPAGKSSDPRSDPVDRAGLKQAEEGSGLSDKNGDKEVGDSLSPGGLKSSEGLGGGLYNPKPSGGGMAGKLGQLLRGNKRRAAIGGGTAGIITVVVAIFSFMSGPLEFVHIAQLLERFHFSAMQDTQDGRLTKIARYIRDPSKPERTRMGVVGNAVADKLEKKMNEGGVKSAYTDTLGYYDGYIVDTSNENFKDKTTAQIKEELVTKYGLDPASLQPSVDSNGKQTIKISADGLSYRQKLSLNKKMLRDVGMSKLSASVGARIMGKRAGITWHPIKKADQKILQKIAEGSKSARDKLKEQFQKDQVDYTEKGVKATTISSQDKTPKDKNGNPTDPNGSSAANQIGADTTDTSTAAGQASQATANGDPNGTNGLKDKLTGKVGTAAGAIGLACIVKGLNEQIGGLRFTGAILPMMRMGGQALSIGSQVQSNTDISAEQLGYFKDQLDAKDKNGHVTSTWNQARSVQAELGETQNGPDLPKAGRVFNQSSPFSFIDGVPGLGPVCDAAGSTVGSIVVGLLGGPINAAVGLVAGEALKPVLGDVAQWLAGTPVNPFASGADRGNYMNYGARLAANDQAVAAGGGALTGSEESQVKIADASVDQAGFKSHNVAYRLFNPDDSRTLASRIIDQQGGNVGQNFARMATGFTGIFSAALKIPSALFSSTVHAASKPYDYGFPKYGFSVADQENSIVKNPFENARKVVPILDADYATIDKPLITRAQKCFGVTLSPDNGAWDVGGGDSSTDLYDGKYPEGECKDSSEAWMRIRFFILDTETVKSYDCYQSDTTTSDQSCSDVGFGDSSTSSSSSSTPTDNGSPPTGSAPELAKQLEPYIKSGKIQCGILGGGNAGCSDITSTAAGKSINGTGGCTVDHLQPALLGMLLKLLQMGHSFSLTAVCSDHHQEVGRHSAGLAADFGIIDGVSLSGTGSWSGPKLEKTKKLDEDIASFMPKSTEFLQQQCHAKFDFLNGFQGASILSDPCHHQHITAGT